MRLLRSIAREIAGLFVEDGSLAAALLAGMAGGPLMLRALHATHWGGPVLATGVIVVLVENVLRSSRPHRKTSGDNTDGNATRRQD
jgi:hypothetical protein